LRAALSCALLASCLLFGHAARAEPAATLIVLIADEPAGAVVSRLERDLRGLGFGVVVLSATPENSGDRAALERAARSLGGLAGVHVLPAGQGSTLWVLEPATGRSVTRELSRPTASNADPNEVALGTLELLRASMLELHPPAAEAHVPAPTPGPSPAPVAPSAPVSDEPARLSLTGGVGAELGLRSVGPSLITLWSVWLRLGGCFGLRGFTALPLSSERARVSEGEVEVRPTLVGAGLACGSERRNSLLRPRVGLGFVGARVETRGIADVAATSHQAAAWLGGGYGLLGIGLGLSSDVRLDLDVTGVVLPTPASILVNRREVATWGAPGGVVSLGLEVSTNL
jgi:hypothetical protein